MQFRRRLIGLLLAVLTVFSMLILVTLWHRNIGQLSTVLLSPAIAAVGELGVNDRAGYVAFITDINSDGKRLGNQLFILAALLFVADRTGRRPVFRHHAKDSTPELERIFQLKDVISWNVTCPCSAFYERQAMTFDQSSLIFSPDNPPNSTCTLELSGYFQSWRYSEPIERLLRRQLVFRQPIENFSNRFLSNVTPTGWPAWRSKSHPAYRQSTGFMRVGVHVRRGDMLGTEQVERGYTTPDENYFRKAIEFFVDRHGQSSPRIQFIAASDDLEWTRKHIGDIVAEVNRVNSKLHLDFVCVSGSAGEDLAVLSSCDHVIMSTGTFGWWAAWLAGGEVIYYSDWPKKMSILHGVFRREDFFPPKWIGMT